MINQLFLGFSLLGAQWVLWILILLSIVSIALILERFFYFRKASKEIETLLEKTLKGVAGSERQTKGVHLVDAAVVDARIAAEKRLTWLSTIGANAPFVGLFGTVLGIIKAFHDLSQAGTQGSAMISSGISEALVATAVGLFVAIPAVVAYNGFQKKVKEMLLRAESVKNRILGEA